MRRAGGLVHQFTFAILLIAFSNPVVGQTQSAWGSDARSYESDFHKWAALATGATTSPAKSAPGDLTYQWIAPDKRSITAVVKIPHPKTGAPDVTLTAVAEGSDARPAFQAALAQVRAQGAGRLVIPTGKYTFKSGETDGSAHLLIQGLTDVTIEGNSSTLIFTKNQPGLLVTGSKRLRLANLNIEFALLTSSLGKVESHDGRSVLVIDPRYQVSAGDTVFYLSEFNPVTRSWVAGGQRVILPPGSKTPALYEEDQTYSSEAFGHNLEGKTFAVFHYWYGGAAIRIGDNPGPNQPEDIVLDKIKIYSAPGMGIFAYGIKRGFAVINSQVNRKNDDISVASTEFDGIHVLAVGGDVVITDNLISGQGDDGINLNGPVSIASSISTMPPSLRLAPYSRFISANDTLAFFDQQGRFLGSAPAGQSKALGGLDYLVNISSPPARFEDTAFVRDVALINSRFVVAHNTIERCNCHGILIQSSNGLVEDNTIRNINRNAIRLISSLGTFKEGSGAMNVIVRNNTITDTGPDSAVKIPWAAITSYGPVKGDVLTPFPVNTSLIISGNKVTNAMDGCITISNSTDTRISENACSGSSLSRPGAPSINVLNSTHVHIDGNKRTGSSTGGIAIDAATSSNVENQANY